LESAGKSFIRMADQQDTIPRPADQFDAFIRPYDFFPSKP
jgi:hypothetical protein